MEKAINHFCHEHPLLLTENASVFMDNADCYACSKPVAATEKAYVCRHKHCRNKTILHKKCGELPTQTQHSKHPHHSLNLFDFSKVKGHLCDVCRRNLDNVIGYRCVDCDFDIDITCEKVGIDALLEGERKQLQHPSHPDHPLTLMRKPAATFYCDGCGEEDADMAYICSSCELWIHKSCALLPATLQHEHHHHQLSLSFSPPTERRGYDYKCGRCDKLIDLTCWVYFCGDCRYFVHLKCVGSTAKPHDSNSNEDIADGSAAEPILTAIEGLNSRIAGLETQLGRIEAVLTAPEAVLAAIEALNGRIAGLETQLARIIANQLGFYAKIGFHPPQ